MKHIRELTLILLAGFMSIQLSFASQPLKNVNPKQPSQDVVVNLFNAFNSHDVEAMLLHVAPNIEWFNITSGRMSLELKGAKDFKTSMNSYFDSLPSARSELRKMHSLGGFVQTIEEAYWLSGTEEKSQCSAATYLIQKGKVQSVWYFPSFEC